jgi:hypothetical protein
MKAKIGNGATVPKHSFKADGYGAAQQGAPAYRPSALAPIDR